MASNSIVQIQVSQIEAPIPETLQQTGAIVSVGGTTLSPGASAALTQTSDLTPILKGAQALTSITYATGSNTATATTTSPHEIPIGDVIELTVAGAAPTAYNGTYSCEITGASTFIYQPAAAPAGSATTPGGYTPENVTELVAQVTSYFSQTGGSGPAVYVLELGAQDTTDAIAALSAYLVANPNTDYVPGASGYYYVYLVPEEFDAQPSYLTLLTTYDGDQAQVYFVTTSTLATYGAYSDLQKDAIVVVPTPAMGVYPQVAVDSVTLAGFEVDAVTIATAQSGSGSYAPSNVLTAVGGTGTEPTFTVTDTKVVSATVASGGTGGTNGTQTVTGTTGTGTKFQASVTVAGGAITAVLSITVPGDYTVNPSVLTAEPVTGASLTGAELSVVMGVLAVTVTTEGNLTAVPANPVATTVSPNVGTGCALTIEWTTEGSASATTAAAHGVAVGQWFQLTGFTPTSWNGWWEAIAGTAGTTLNFNVPSSQAAVSEEGFLAANMASSPGPGATEFQAAGVFYDILATNPSPTNRAQPFQFRYQFGVTPWPRQGLGTIQLALKEAAVNIIKTGAEGGISNACLYWGTTKDGRGILYWYSVDWMAINGRINVANTVINGSNDPVNPLYYDQPGINRLQDSLTATVNSAVTNGLATGQVVKTAMVGADLSAAIEAGTFNGQMVVNAVPLLPYLAANPSDYAAQTYNGLSVLYITNQGFISILINIEVTDLIATQ